MIRAITSFKPNYTSTNFTANLMTPKRAARCAEIRALIERDFPVEVERVRLYALGYDMKEAKELAKKNLRAQQEADRAAGRPVRNINFDV
jgi:hypothetical protein